MSKFDNIHKSLQADFMKVILKYIDEYNSLLEGKENDFGNFLIEVLLGLNVNILIRLHDEVNGTDFIDHFFNDSYEATISAIKNKFLKGKSHEKNRSH